jgi:adenosylcobinamide-GDP ribazoletransferase
MFKQLKALIAFLTIIPIKGEYDLKTTAEGIHLFPLIGALIGFITGIIAFLISNIYPGLITGIIATSVLELITGLHHFDALLDFGDGIMAKTTPERKIEIMHDKQTGAGGFWLGTHSNRNKDIFNSSIKWVTTFYSNHTFRNFIKTLNGNRGMVR